jgi:MFS family permease
MNYKWITLSNTTIGTLASLDRNIVIIALPTIASDLHTSFFTLTWIVLVYWLVTASVLLNFGRLSDMFGRVKLYNIGFAIFTLGSGLCSISQTGEQLILFRIIQAVGAAFLFSNSAAIITDTFPENERAKALGLNQTAIVVGSVVGLVFGGSVLGLLLMPGTNIILFNTFTSDRSLCCHGMISTFSNCLTCTFSMIW